LRGGAAGELAKSLERITMTIVARMIEQIRLTLCWAAALAFAASANAAGAKQIDFNRDIRAILSNNCVACHGPDEKERKAGLRLDTREGALRDLGGYQAVKPGHPEESELIRRITTLDEGDLMPPPEKGKRLSPREVQ